MANVSDNIAIKRIYDDATVSDGYRILIDRLWPRGVSKERASLGEWMKEIAPSDKLRKSFHSGQIDFAKFRLQYHAELRGEEKLALLARIMECAEKGKVTLLYSAKDETNNQAAVLWEYLLRG